MGLRLVMHPVPPFRLDFTVWALRRLPINEMDLWDGSEYRRILCLGDEAVEMKLTQSGPVHDPELEMTLNACVGRDVEGTSGTFDGSGGSGRVKDLGLAPTREANLLDRAKRQATSILGLDVDLHPFYQLAATAEPLARLADRFRGLKPPRFPTVFEGVVNGVACQQLSLNVGIRLLDRLCAGYGVKCGSQHAFPSPAALASLAPAALRSLGFSNRKAEYIIGLAQAVDSGAVDLESLADLDDEAAVAELDRLEGVGRWTAQYVALRALGRVDVFPADDVGSQDKMRRWLSLEQRPGYEEANRRIAGFRPYRGLIYFHLLLNHLAERGVVTPNSGEE